MINTPDWESAKQRMAAMLNGEKLDRPCIQIAVPKDPNRPAQERGLHNPENTSVVELLDAFEANAEGTLFLGEAFPSYSLSFGPDQFAAFLGCDLEYTVEDYTSWAKPNITDWGNPPSFEWDPSNKWWKRMVDMMEYACKRAEGRYLLQCPDTHAGGDAVAAMRGQADLCLDLIDCPENVEAAMAKIERAAIPYFDAMFGIMMKHQTETPCMGCAMPGTSVIVQCDFIALISTAMVERFFLNEMRIETEYVDHCFFHLDGPDAIKHMDVILELPELDGLNYVKGANADFTFAHELELYKRVQEAGKIAVLGVGKDRLSDVLEVLDPHKLFLRMGAANEDEARAVLADAVRMTK